MKKINPVNLKNSDISKYFLITVDVEDWFQVENFKPWIPFDTWDRRELRVERNIHRLLDLFDSIPLSCQPSQSPPKNNKENFQTNKIHSKPKATFFVLGWIAERIPHLVREIAARGHEVASHGCNHDLPNQLNKNKLKDDLNSSRKSLEDAIGNQVKGYRAPSFAINDYVLKSIEECGYLYDSSYNSFGLHQRYGKISVNGLKKCRVGYKLSENFYELPISNIDPKKPIGNRLKYLKLNNNMRSNFILPFGGGGYFRLLPYLIMRLGIRYKLEQESAFVFYMHPWEIDHAQPRVKAAPMKYQFRHYTNLKSNYHKLRRMIIDFRSCQFITCTQYIDGIEVNPMTDRAIG